MKSVLDFYKAKAEKNKISMVTSYDYWSAKIIEQTNIDCILVGDSLAMTMHGQKDTLAATPELMALHVAAVRKGAPSKFIVGDMPFLAHRGDLNKTIEAVQLIMRAGAQALKIEGLQGSEKTFAHIVESGVPVMGHLGLTPQSYHAFGGFKVQATEDKAAQTLINQACTLQEIGCFAVVLECIPSKLAKIVSSEIKIPTIGIGAGADCDGQVLVLQDMMGFNHDFKPKFVRRFRQGFEWMQTAFNEFDEEVKNQKFPAENESYQI